MFKKQGRKGTIGLLPESAKEYGISDSAKQMFSWEK